MPLTKPLFDLPESIHKIGFVEVLASAVANPAATASTYVVTPPLAEAFDRSLSLVGSSLKQHRSQASYLHGSFGSGKSHFMAMLSLMLRGDEHVWRIPELHPLRAKHPFIGTAKLLELHFHMVGHDSLEQAVFTRYLEWVRTNHPNAPLPGLFADEKLFDDARQLLDKIGDDPFFEPMNAGAKVDDDWGSFGADERWDRPRFDRAASSLDPDFRGDLFAALARTWFKAFASESRQYLDLDTGLGVIGRHAKRFGYDAIVLFLDELILWLASRSSDKAWFHNEIQKMVKLVEAQDVTREIPFVSFIARQRDLAEMVGEDYAGDESKLVRDSLKWSEGRYERINLEDRNLPAIVEKRVLKPKNDAARVELDHAFDGMKRAAGPAWQTMLGELDAKDFRRLYPFSPALVEALVALSNSLQRERTAIKLLTELLIEHIEDLQIGEVVGVGDLWDVLAGGEDSAQGVMKSRFEAAKQLYTFQLLPLIQKDHGTDKAETCPRLRTDHAARIGCSNCANKPCRTDNRLVKTLIVAALVPEVKVLRDMTASKLVQLNHGSLKVPVVGAEASLATAKLRKWAAQLGQLHVGPQADPTVRLELQGVDLAPILDQARQYDTAGARQRVVKEILFEAMGLDAGPEWTEEHQVDWRGTKRRGEIRFGNVRKMSADVLRCPDEHDWRLIVDYPFDDPGFGPHDDEQVVEKFRDETGGAWTLVWLPSFFSAPVNQMLGELVILEHIMKTQSDARQYVSHLSIEQQARALNDLTNLRTQKRSHVGRVLEQAYGLAKARPGELDESQTVDRHLHVLKAGAQIQPSLAANLTDAIDNYVSALLEARWPRHPSLGKPLTGKRVDELVEKFGDIVDADDKRVPADKGLVDEMKGTLAELGLVRVTETHILLREEDKLSDLDRKRRQKASERPEVGEVRQWIDEHGKMGLQTAALDLIVRCFARWDARTFVVGDQPFDVRGGKPIPAFVVLEKPDLPTPTQWGAAIARAGATLGVTLDKRALNADSLKRFEAAVSQAVGAKAEAAGKVAETLPSRLGELALGAEVDRARTAQSASALCAGLKGRGGKGQVEVLAGFEPETSDRAVGTSIASAAEVAVVLGDDLVFGAFAQLRSREGEVVGATELLQEAVSALRQDELHIKLAPKLRTLAVRALELLNPRAPTDHVVYSVNLAKGGRAAILAQLRAVVADVEKATVEGDEALKMVGSVRITKPEPKR